MVGIERAELLILFLQVRLALRN